MLREFLFGLGISHFDLVWVSLFYFLHLMRCHVRIGCCKVECLHHDRTIGALLLIRYSLIQNGQKMILIPGGTKFESISFSVQVNIFFFLLCK
jgi:hypothetical protein